MKKMYYIIFIISLLISIFIISLVLNNKSYKCSMNKQLIDGIELNEIINVRVSFKKIKQISIIKNFMLNDYYANRDTYYNSINELLKKTYGNNIVNITKNKNKISSNITIKNKGIVLDNIIITQNGVENSSLRYDSNNNLNSDKAVKINEKINLSKLKKYGYTCK